jgi:hypothetical protein
MKQLIITGIIGLMILSACAGPDESPIATPPAQEITAKQPPSPQPPVTQTPISPTGQSDISVASGSSTPVPTDEARQQKIKEALAQIAHQGYNLLGKNHRAIALILAAKLRNHSSNSASEYGI